MNWNVDSGVISRYTNCNLLVITDIKLIAYNTELPEIVEVPVKSAETSNGFLTILFTNLSNYLTERTEANTWVFGVKLGMNYNEISDNDDNAVISDPVTIGINENELSYLGFNSINLCLNLDIACDINKDYKLMGSHIQNPELMHGGESKSDLFSYSGNEINVQLNNQYI